MLEISAVPASLPTWQVYQNGAMHLHHLGPRSISEFLREVGLVHDIDADITERLTAWQRLSPELVREVLNRFAAGRHFPRRLVLVP